MRALVANYSASEARPRCLPRSSSGVSICTFVPAKQVKREPAGALKRSKGRGDATVNNLMHVASRCAKGERGRAVVREAPRQLQPGEAEHAFEELRPRAIVRLLYYIHIYKCTSPAECARASCMRTLDLYEYADA